MPRKYSADDKEFDLVESSTKKAKTETESHVDAQETVNTKETSLPSLDQLKKLSAVVADTGEINAIAKYKPQDATTNPSLIYKAAILKEYEHVLEDAIQYALSHSAAADSASLQIDIAMDRLAVNFGSELSKLVPGFVSTEVDARLSFNTDETVNRARRIIKMYEELGVDKNRILIKIAATYEGKNS